MYDTTLHTEAGRQFKQQVIDKVTNDFPFVADYSFDDILTIVASITSDPAFINMDSHKQGFYLAGCDHGEKDIKPLRNLNIFKVMNHIGLLFNAVINVENQIIQTHYTDTEFKITLYEPHSNILSASLTLFPKELICFFARVLAEGPHYCENDNMYEYLIDMCERFRDGKDGQATIEEIQQMAKNGEIHIAVSTFLNACLTHYSNIIAKHNIGYTVLNAKVQPTDPSQLTPVLH